MRALLALALLLTALAAPAEAQTVLCAGVNQTCQTTTQVTIHPPDEPIPVMGDFAVLPVEVQYTYVPTSFSLTSTPIELQLTRFPPWAAATLSPSTLHAPVDFLPSGLQPVTRTLHAFLLVSATSDAPAFTQGVLEVQAHAHGNGNLQASSGSVQVPVQADYFGALGVQAPSALALRGGEGKAVPLTITNLGNAATRVSFEVAAAPAGVKVTPPGELTLESRQQGADGVTQGTAFGVEAVRSFEAGPVVLRALPSYALDGEVVGSATSIVLHLTPRGGDDASLATQTLMGDGQAASPLTFGLLAAGLAGTVLLERHRRQRRKAP
jgi:hypothetical protein